MKNLFIDCGTAEFQGITMFDNIYKFDPISWDLILIEANPITYIKAKENVPFWLTFQNFIFLNQAVATGQGKIVVNCADVFSDSFSRLNIVSRFFSRIRFYISRKIKNNKFMSQGSNILSSPPKQDRDHSFTYQQREVPIFNLSSNIFDNKDKYRYLIIKMDIEGAEFQVLDDLIETGAAKYIHSIYVEFHERFFENSSEYEQKKLNLIAKLKDFGVIVVDWF